MTGIDELIEYIEHLEKLDKADETKLKERRAKIKTKLPYSMRKIND